MPDLVEILLQLLMVFAVGGAIGAEREYQSKHAGFRTMILICLGSYLFSLLSINISGNETDRIASNIVTGIGFIGAGVIYKSENNINGITTAATIWVVAALGMGIAAKIYLIVLISTVFILVALLALTHLEKYIERINQYYTYKIVSEYSEELLREYENLFTECELKYRRIRRLRRGSQLIGTWIIHGKEQNHHKLTKILMKHPTVKEFEF